MTHFETFTQYDKKFGSINHNVCSLFAVITADNFLKNSFIDKSQHEKNLTNAVKQFSELGLGGEIDFKTLLSFTSLDTKDIDCTCVELVKSGDIGFEHMLPENDKPFCVIFLKNSKFFTVLFTGNKYCIRDCHEIFQYDFDTKIQLIKHLSDIYQFDKEINLDGYNVDNFSSIEFIKIFNEFTYVLSQDDIMYEQKDNPAKDKKENPAKDQKIEVKKELYNGLFIPEIVNDYAMDPNTEYKPVNNDYMHYEEFEYED